MRSAAPGGAAPVTYQLVIRVARTVEVRIGALGPIRFPAGRYLYTGSARRAIDARVARHLRGAKRPHWHIDYLLAAPGVRVVSVRLLACAECEANRAAPGEILVARFGAGDCRAGCVSHLKFQGPWQP